MPRIEVGRRLGSYEIVALHGSGASSEVWRARDRANERDVAIQALPVKPARFEQDAKTLASLNHPNVATFYELLEHEGTHYVVSELIDGETLSDRLPLRPEDAASLFRQIAEALEQAHENGVLHRGLEPGRILVKKDGTVKLVDFGLTTAPAPYMSPEEARGAGVDRRADIWAFGCCLYETLTGKPAFPAESEHEPKWEALPAGTPASVRAVLRRSVTTDLRQRFQHIGDVRLELESPSEAPAIASRHERYRWALIPAAGVLLGAVAVALAPRTPSHAPVVRLEMETERLDAAFHPVLAMSPDGSTFAYSDWNRTTRLRRLDGTFDAEIPGADESIRGSSARFFSPDGEWIAFFANHQLMKMPVRGGRAAVVAAAEGIGPRAGSWGDDDRIVFSVDSELVEVPARGGEATPLTRVERDRGESGHHFPDVLPGSRGVLFTVNGPRTEYRGEVAVYDRDTETVRILFEGTTPRYSDTGHLVFYRGGGLHAAPFDLDTLEPVGDPVPVVEDVYVSRTGAAHFSISRNGTLAYIPAHDVSRELVWLGRQGDVVSRRTVARDIGYPRYAPDGERFSIDVTDGLHRNIWVSELSRDTLTPLIRDASAMAEWTPDGLGIAYFRLAFVENPYFALVDSPESAQPLTNHKGQLLVSSWSPDGSVAAITSLDENTGFDLTIVSRDGTTTPQSFVRTGSNEVSAEFSPDGRHIAYISDETGGRHLLVQPYPGPGAPKQVTTERGAFNPVWHPSGRELYYVFRHEELRAVSVGTVPEFEVLSEPRTVFKGDYQWWAQNLGRRNFDLSPDGETFMMIERSEEFWPTHVEVVLNWHEELKRLVPVP